MVYKEFLTMAHVSTIYDIQQQATLVIEAPSDWCLLVWEWRDGQLSRREKA